MSLERMKTGRSSEDMALLYLKEQGYEIVERNYRTKYGEIDIIGCDKGCFCFIEVRSSSSARFDSPLYSIDKNKQDKISKAALSYIKKRCLEDKDSRFDVVCIENAGTGSPRIQLIKDAFELDNWYRY